ncbi:MAG: NADPH-dependent assimilatory sulfite reductase hemoprotein subunit [Myxococcota bacterium]|nr:NADPH-dependent assimilatory sulfite reductase hemoprotein subunit [Deltaproteobacteria bacterium]MCP4241006.1 NADPH-dependent assimilatory sulfite reductase hemoprotein subunit [bacterium]MDP6075794.1 NADPH-dependent assimilatory sulfite reductase hemoprotein subunit [Myxococcota bacterium]MDP6242569.1 NADPH-dependent assimilatory sulfite reductase hemoprotein subunit [Myxococcota bacterium]MDP7075539.1 NADPH-dependent assimilatory sulfite reductase hemoprotein subunit [Myxococcota bacteriu
MSDFESAAEAVSLASADLAQMSANERLKAASQGLYYVSAKGEVHTFLDEIEALDRGEPTIGNVAKELSKFFGIYKQQERGERGRKTDDYFFMVRIRNPGGGGLNREQWAAVDDASDAFADGTIRITSRQSIQYHHVYGPKLAPLVRCLNRGYRDRATLGACGDVNRNVMCSPVDGLEPEHATGGRELAEAIAEELAPQSSAYFQVFLSDEEGRNAGPVNATEPLYGEQYLPRKFKVGIAHPADNSADVLTQDVGLVPVGSDGAVWDLHSGGGLGLTHNNPKTAALFGLYLGRVSRAQVVEAVRAICVLQKENGDRKNRKLARWKYTIRRLGPNHVKAELRDRFGIALEDAEPVALPPVQFHLGWHEQRDGRYWYGISVENGRMGPVLRRAVRRAVDELDLSVRLTSQQDLLLCDVRDRKALERILEEGRVKPPETISRVRRNAMACPAKPTCGLAMTDAENVLPRYIDAIDAAGLGDVDVVIRMTGCPNNCVRPPSAEIGIYGYGKNDHVILVGGSREGSRLAQVLYPRVPEEQMVEALVGLLRAVKERNPEGLPAGEFLHRTEPEALRGWVGIESV